MLMCGCADVRMCKCADVRMCGCGNVLIHFVSGERGIRTLGTVTSTTVFETVPFDRSGISPVMDKSFCANTKIINLSVFHGRTIIDLPW